MLQNELIELYTKYKNREEKSLEYITIPEGKYLCIRMDGFKASKNFLKDVVVNKKFNEAMVAGYSDLYYSFRHYLTRDLESAIIGSLIINDELSIILNKENDADDYKRIMKMSTLFAGMMASKTYMPGAKSKGRKYIAFDARPILLSEDEIPEYFRHRYLTGVRYAHWKVLRLDKFIDPNNQEIKHNIDEAMKLTKQFDIENKAQRVIASYGLYMAEQSKRPAFTKLGTTENTMSLEQLKSKVETSIDFCTYTRQKY